MSYRIIADSCCDKTSEMSQWGNITFVPLTLEEIFIYELGGADYEVKDIVL